MIDAEGGVESILYNVDVGLAQATDRANNRAATLFRAIQLALLPTATRNCWLWLYLSCNNCA